MTLEQLQAKRETILGSVGEARVQFGERSIEYSKQQDSLALVDAEIAKVLSPDEPRVFTVQTNRGLA